MNNKNKRKRNLVSNLEGRATLNLSIKANGDASVNGIEELEEIAAATVDPVVNGHVVNQRLAYFF